MWLRNNKITILLILSVYWIAFNYLVLHTSVNIFQVPDVKAIKNVEYANSHVSTPEALTGENWNTQTLPDDWSLNHNNTEQIWYRAEFELGELFQSVWAVYLPSISHNAEVYINGIWIGQAGAFNNPVSRHHNEPLLFNFSPQLLRRGNNQIEIRVVTAFHQQGFLSEIYIAPKQKLTGAYEFKHFVRVDLMKWVTISLYAISLIVFAFWLARPQDSVYLVFALELFFWATHNLNLIISDIPVSARLWEAMTMCTFGWLIISMIFFNHRYAGGMNKKIEKFMLVFAVCGLGFFALPDIGSILFIGYKIWDSVLVLFGTYAMYHLIKVYWQYQHFDVFLMMLVGVPILVFGLHDYLMINQLGNRQDGLLIQYSVIPTVLLFSWFMVRRFVQSINKAETFAAHLEHRVAENKLEIHSQYEKLRSLEKQSVLAEERERIMRDMHDGIGGQLVSVISVLQEQDDEIFIKVRKKIQLSLTDLRFVIDSLDPLQNELPTMLGMMRLRLHDQLDAANIQLEWGVTELPELPEMSPGMSLHIMRIVQEAITNCIKHADSQKMLLATGVHNQQVFIDIIDYGKGINKQDNLFKDKGRGISNMHYRAQQIGASLDMKSSSDGTQIRLLLAPA